MHADTEEEGKGDMRQMDLFREECHQVTLDELKANCSSLDWYKEKGIVLGLDSEDILKPYYDREYSFDCPPLYLMDCVNAEIEGKTSMRYMVISTNGHLVAIVFKIIQLMKTKRIHLFDIPLSEDNESMMEVLEVLKKSSIITFIFKEKYLPLFGKCERKESYNDYYFDLEKDNERLFMNNEWQKDIGIRKFIRNENGYHIVNLQGMHQYDDAMLECRRRWWNAKGEKTRDNERKSLVNSLKISSSKVWNVALMHKDTVLAVKTLIIHDGYAVMPLLFHVSRDYVELRSNGIDNIVLRHLDKCMRYASGKMLLENGIKREYMLGFAPGNKSLKKHKETISSGCIRYYSTVRP